MNKRVWISFAGMIAVDIDVTEGMSKAEIRKLVRSAWIKLENEEVGENADMFEWDLD